MQVTWWMPSSLTARRLATLCLAGGSLLASRAEPPFDTLDQHLGEALAEAGDERHGAVEEERPLAGWILGLQQVARQQEVREHAEDGSENRPVAPEDVEAAL